MEPQQRQYLSNNITLPNVEKGILGTHILNSGKDKGEMGKETEWWRWSHGKIMPNRMNDAGDADKLWYIPMPNGRKTSQPNNKKAMHGLNQAKTIHYDVCRVGDIKP